MGNAMHMHSTNPDDLHALFHSVSRCFDGNTFVTFEKLEREAGTSIANLLARKQDLEQLFRQEDPDLRLTSCVDLSPPGWHLES